MKRWIAIILLAVILCFSSCGSPSEASSAEEHQSVTETEAETIELWVLTEKTTVDHMNYQAKEIAKLIEKEYENVEIRLDILPYDEEERALYLESLRVQILAGDGPDIYLFPTSNQLRVKEGILLFTQEVDLLFSDVAQSMHNGLFYDISQFYDADEELEKGRLVNAVMDAGCIGDARYVLPFHYNYGVVYALTDELEASGMDVEAIESGILGLYQTAIATGEPLRACGAECTKTKLSLFGQVIDYENQEVAVSPETFAEYLELYQQIKTLMGSKTFHRVSVSITDYLQPEVNENLYSGQLFSFPMRVGTLDHLLPYKMMANAEELELTTIPLRGVDGKLTAEVTYYGAVGSGCEHPELAYEYLRLFLTEEYQWENTRPQSTAEKYYSEETDGLVSPGWPVMTEGSVNTMWDRVRSQYYHVLGTGMTAEKKAVLGKKLTDEDLPILQTEIDQAVFPVLELDNEYTKTFRSVHANSDFLAEAEELIQELAWHVAEG